jgi:hypothetical protein
MYPADFKRGFNPSSIYRNLFSLSFGATKVVTLFFLPKNSEAFFPLFFLPEILSRQVLIFTLFQVTKTSRQNSSYSPIFPSMNPAVLSGCKSNQVFEVSK